MKDGPSAPRPSGAAVSPAPDDAKAPTKLDIEFARQALGERAITRAQLQECLGAQKGYGDRKIHRALPIIVCGLSYLNRRRVEQLLRHVIRRLGSISIGEYQCVSQLGRGGMGIVYRALQRRFDRVVALKVLCRPDINEMAVARFRHEGRASTAVRHQNIVAALDVGEAEGWHYFAMEYVEGKTLSRLVAEQGAFTEQQAVALTAQVADALAHAHEQGIIHRDVKPSNILVTGSSIAKLCDLGLSKMRDLDESYMHESGTTVGSRRFISPEQARGIENADARTDIYSLGLVLYYMVTGKLPFAEVPVEEVMKEHLRGRLPWAAAVAPGVSPSISWLITRMSAPDPANRYATTAELAHDLHELLKRLSG